MPEWNDKKFRGLLTPTIWKNSEKTIKEKLYLEYWGDSRYIHLLVPSIFSIRTNNIKDGIKLLEKYGVSEYITNRCLRRNARELEILIKYLLKNNIDLVVEEPSRKPRLNNILNSSNAQLKEKYNIDIKELAKEKEGADR